MVAGLQIASREREPYSTRIVHGCRQEEMLRAFCFI